VSIEQPTYPAIIDSALAHHARLIPIPVSVDGWDLTSTDLSTRPPVLAHLTFDAHNPTGRWASESERHHVLTRLPASTTVAIDETLAEFPCTTSEPKPTVPIPHHDIVSLGSMNKAFWSGLRIGWIRASADLIRRIAAVRTGLDLAPAVLEQLIAHQLLIRADELLPQRRRLIATRRTALLEALDQASPGWRYDPPQGGLSVWVDLGGISSTDLAELALEQGVRITPGTRFTITGTHDRWIRLPFVRPSDDLAAAVDILAAVAERAGRARRRSRLGPERAWAV
jgi:DNA-binding transcriptional MocR family regulator